MELAGWTGDDEFTVCSRMKCVGTRGLERLGGERESEGESYTATRFATTNSAVA